MMKNLKEADIVFFSDISYVYHKNKKQIKRLFFALFILPFSLYIFSEAYYVSSASFLEAKEKISSHKDKLKEVLLEMGGIQNSQLSKVLFESRELTYEVISKNGLQIEKKKTFSPTYFLHNFLENIKAEIGLRLNDTKFFSIENVSYKEEKKFPFYLIFTTERYYSVFNKKGKLLGKGLLKRSFTSDKLSFTLQEIPKNLQLHKAYYFTAQPLDKAFKKVQKRLSIEKNKKIPELVKLSYKDRNRELAKNVLESFFAGYKNHYKKIIKEKAENELQYVTSIQDKINGELEQEIKVLLENQNKAKELGLINSTGPALQYKTKNLEELSHKIQQLELEEEKLLAYQKNNLVPYTMGSTDAFSKNSLEKNLLIKKLKEEVDKSDTLLLSSFIHQLLDMKIKSTAALTKTLQEFELLKAFEKETFDVQSRVIDKAHIPRLAERKNAPLYSLLIASFSAGVALYYYFLKQLQKGLPLHKKRCHILQLPYEGYFKFRFLPSLANLHEKELNTLRSILYKTLKANPFSTSAILCILSKSPNNIAEKICELAHSQKRKALLIDLNAPAFSLKEEDNMLIPKENFDILLPGIFDNFMMEYVASSQFQIEINKQIKNYDLMVINSSHLEQDSIAHLLKELSHYTIVADDVINEHSIALYNERKSSFSFIALNLS